MKSTLIYILNTRIATLTKLLFFYKVVHLFTVFFNLGIITAFTVLSEKKIVENYTTVLEIFIVINGIIQFAYTLLKFDKKTYLCTSKIETYKNILKDIHYSDTSATLARRNIEETDKELDTLTNYLFIDINTPNTYNRDVADLNKEYEEYQLSRRQTVDTL